jgi:hypothetical protein
MKEFKRSGRRCNNEIQLCQFSSRQLTFCWSREGTARKSKTVRGGSIEWGEARRSTLIDKLSFVECINDNVKKPGILIGDTTNCPIKVSEWPKREQRYANEIETRSSSREASSPLSHSKNFSSGCVRRGGGKRRPEEITLICVVRKARLRGQGSRFLVDRRAPPRLCY